jgi:hypothetical protein
MCSAFNNGHSVLAKYPQLVLLLLLPSLPLSLLLLLLRRRHRQLCGAPHAQHLTCRSLRSHERAVCCAAGA